MYEEQVTPEIGKSVGCEAVKYRTAFRRVYNQKGCPGTAVLACRGLGLISTFRTCKLCGTSHRTTDDVDIAIGVVYELSYQKIEVRFAHG
jgi:hypothetical protein